MSELIWLAPITGVAALIFATVLASSVKKQEAGDGKMKEIAAAIKEGAQAFLQAEYKILVIFVAILFVVIGVGIGNWMTAVCFLVGAAFSTMAGYFGMQVATDANVRTAHGAGTGGMGRALGIAYKGGAVMGMCVVGLGLLGVSVIYLFTKDVNVLTGYSLGASSIALFARVGGGGNPGLHGGNLFCKGKGWRGSAKGIEYGKLCGLCHCDSGITAAQQKLLWKIP